MVQGMELHWRGKHILKAMIDDLLNNRGLAKATDIVISGCSAGGLASKTHTLTHTHIYTRIRIAHVGIP